MFGVLVDQKLDTLRYAFQAQMPPSRDVLGTSQNSESYCLISVITLLGRREQNAVQPMHPHRRLDIPVDGQIGMLQSK